jgi:hypothetical protein
MSTPSNFDHVRTTKEIKQLVYDIAEKLDAAAWQIAKLLLEWQETFVCDDPEMLKTLRDIVKAHAMTVH